MNICRTVLLFSLTFACITGQAQETLEQRMAIASKLAEYELVRVFSDDVLRELSQALPPQSRADFVSFMTSPDNKAAMVKALALVAAQTFTAAELQALLDFNTSPVGQSINSKQALYTRQSMAAMNREIKPLFDKFMSSRK